MIFLTNYKFYLWERSKLTYLYMLKWIANLLYAKLCADCLVHACEEGTFLVLSEHAVYGWDEDWAQGVMDLVSGLTAQFRKVLREIHHQLVAMAINISQSSIHTHYIALKTMLNKQLDDPAGDE